MEATDTVLNVEDDETVVCDMASPARALGCRATVANDDETGFEAASGIAGEVRRCDLMSAPATQPTGGNASMSSTGFVGLALQGTGPIGQYLDHVRPPASEPGTLVFPTVTRVLGASGQLRAEPVELVPAFRREETRPVVLLVDDDRSIGTMYGVGLEALGFQVSFLNDVSAVFLAVEEEVPDVVVLDFQLGGIVTGVDVLENLRLDRRMAHIPAFILSNHLGDLNGEIDRAFAAGAVAWLVKSKTSPAVLGLRIREALASM